MHLICTTFFFVVKELFGVQISIFSDAEYRRNIKNAICPCLRKAVDNRSHICPRVVRWSLWAGQQS